jgi:serine phosphatase RsbU (regulator of sigma subunit)
MRKSLLSFGEMSLADNTSWHRRSEPSLPHFKLLPFRRQRTLFLAAFCIFSVIGFFVDLMRMGELPYALVLIIAILSGGIAVLYVIFGTRFPRYYSVMLTVFQILFWNGFSAAVPSFISYFHLQPVTSEHGMRFAAISILVLVILSYIFFISFIRNEGQEVIRIKNELELAHGIQKTLVPPIEMRTASFELYGRSDPSDKVGGDLVDAVLLDGGSTVADLADIAGHGLQAGILMGMLKTAARTALLDAGSVESRAILPSLMERLNCVLPCVKEPQMYATFAGFLLNPDGSVYYALAAHPPILHYRRHTEKPYLEQISVEAFPLGLLPVSGFSSAVMTMAPGDLLIAVTDGILEACNQADEEFGLERLQDVIVNHASDSLPALADSILGPVREFGKQVDDQTLLLIRRL